MSESNILPNKIDQLQVSIINYEGESVNVTGLCEKVEIFEGIFQTFSTITLLITDAIGLIERFPILGDEMIVVTYKTPGERYKLRTRTYKLYKTGERVEAAQRQVNFTVHGIDEYALFQEMQNVDKSFVGKNVLEAVEDIYNTAALSGSTSGVDVSDATSAGTTGGLGDLGGTASFMQGTDTSRATLSGTFGKDNVTPSEGVQGRFIQQRQTLYGRDKERFTRDKCRSFTTYCSPGGTPMEAIKMLLDEAIHVDTNNNSDFIFFQTYEGFHCTTIGELKDERGKTLEFLLGDQALVQNNEEERFTAQHIIIEAKIKKFVDVIQNLGTGLYKNRVVVVDPLTKRYDSRIFTYQQDFSYLKKLNGRGNRIHADNSLYRKPPSSTHTRYLVGELTTNSLNKIEPSGFSPDRRDALSFLTYQQSPYLNRSDLSRDPKIKFPNERHKVLNRKIGERALLDSLILEIAIPGNSDVKAGDVIYVFAPQPSASEAQALDFNLFFGIDKARFLVTAVRHVYSRTTLNFVTQLDLMKDSLEFKPETIRRKVRAEFGS